MGVTEIFPEHTLGNLYQKYVPFRRIDLIIVNAGAVEVVIACQPHEVAVAYRPGITIAMQVKDGILRAIICRTFVRGSIRRRVELLYLVEIGHAYEIAMLAGIGTPPGRTISLFANDLHSAP